MKFFIQDIGHFLLKIRILVQDSGHFSSENENFVQDGGHFLWKTRILSKVLDIFFGKQEFWSKIVDIFFEKWEIEPTTWVQKYNLHKEIQNIGIKFKELDNSQFTCSNEIFFTICGFTISEKVWKKSVKIFPRNCEVSLTILV